MIPHDTIDALAACFATLSELGSHLSEDQWKSPTDLPGWTVQDNLSHLVAIERTLEGLPGTTHRAPSVDYVKNPIGEMNENEIDSRRHLSGAEVLAEWNDITSRRLHTLRSADDSYFDAPAMTPTGPGTVADFLNIRVLDCWVHEQDMRRAIGVPGHLSGPAAELTIDRLIRTIPIVVGKRAGTPEGESVVIDIVPDPVLGGVRRHIVCTVDQGRAHVVETEPASVRAGMSLDTDTFVVLATGRRTFDDVAGRITLTDDQDHARRVLGQLNMMI